MNEALFHYLNNLAGKSEFFDTLVIFFGEYLPYWLFGGLFLFLIFGKDKKKELKMVFFALISAVVARFVFTEIIRYFYYIPRPFVNNEVYQLISHEAVGSFPTGHGSFFIAIAIAVFFFHKRWSVLFFIGAFLIPMARVIAGIHWPADILAGAVVGIFSAYIIYLLFRKRLQKPLENL